MRKTVIAAIFGALIPLAMAAYIPYAVTSGNNKQRVEFVGFAGSAAYGSNCTSTPCTIVYQSGSWVTSVSRSSTGQYSINIASGVFSSVPNCVSTPDNVGNLSSQVGYNGSSSTLVKIYGYNTSSTLSDSSFHVICMGPR